MFRFLKAPLGVAAALLIGFAGAGAFAHGDVTPHPIDTTGLPALGQDRVLPNPYRGNAKAEEIGAEGYLHNCAGCHGLDAVSGGMAPDVRAMGKDCLSRPKADQADCIKDNDDYFHDIVMHGKKNSEGRYTMPAYGGVFTQEAVWAVKAYIDKRTAESMGK